MNFWELLFGGGNPQYLQMQQAQPTAMPMMPTQAAATEAMLGAPVGNPMMPPSMTPQEVAQRSAAMASRINPFYSQRGGRAPVPPMYTPNLGGSYVAPQDMTTYQDVVNQYGYAGLAGGGPYGGGSGTPGAPGPATGTPARWPGLFGNR